jgi:cytochrome c-type biogenesis protein CcmH
MQCARIIFFILLFALPAVAMEATEQLANPVQEQRARQLFKQIRCVVCQAESIDESQALLATDMRTFVRQAVAEDKTDETILADLQDKYGDAVLMAPPLRVDTGILWFAPAAMLLIGGLVWWRQGKRT